MLRYNLPKYSLFFQKPQRKPSASRYQSEAIQHKAVKDVKQAFRKLNPTVCGILTKLLDILLSSLFFLLTVRKHPVR